jgi:hypothetical protein
MIRTRWIVCLFYLPFGQPDSAIQRWMHENVPDARRATTQANPESHSYSIPCE